MSSIDRGRHFIADKKLAAYSIIVSLMVLLLFSRSSPLYPMNTWVDVNCFFTVGRAIKHGMVPYLDIYEQKGPLLYFLFAVAACISERSFVGVFAVEVILFACFVYESMRIAFLWEKNRTVWIIAPVLFGAIAASKAFALGCSAEEMALPFSALSLRILLSRVTEKRTLTPGEAVVIGVCGAVVFWIKYSLCGFYAGIEIAILVWYIDRGWMGRIGRQILMTACGVLTLSGVILVWFALRGGLAALIHAYFIDNMTLYSSGYSPFYITEKLIRQAFTQNWMWSIPTVMGMAWLLWKKYRIELGMYTFCIIGTTMVIALTGRWFDYYLFALAVSAPVALCIRLPIKQSIALCVSVVLSAVLTINAVGKIEDAQSEPLPQYTFAECMQENSTLLNYGFLDGGFYFASGTLPTNRFFCKLNIPLPEMMEEQDKLVQEGRFDYLVTRDGASVPGDRYDIVVEQEYDGFTYRLFERQ